MGVALLIQARVGCPAEASVVGLGALRERAILTDDGGYRAGARPRWAKGITGVIDEHHPRGASRRHSPARIASVGPGRDLEDLDLKQGGAVHLSSELVNPTICPHVEDGVAHGRGWEDLLMRRLKERVELDRHL